MPWLGFTVDRRGVPVNSPVGLWLPTTPLPVAAATRGDGSRGCTVSSLMATTLTFPSGVRVAQT